MSAVSIIAVIISGIAVIFTIIAFVLSRNKESKQTVTEELLKFDGIKESLLKVNMKLDQVCTTTSETRTDIKAMGNQLQEMDKRLTIVERDQADVWEALGKLQDR